MVMFKMQGFMLLGLCLFHFVLLAASAESVEDVKGKNDGPGLRLHGHHRDMDHQTYLMGGSQHKTHHTERKILEVAALSLRGHKDEFFKELCAPSSISTCTVTKETFRGLIGSEGERYFPHAINLFLRDEHEGQYGHWIKANAQAHGRMFHKSLFDAVEHSVGEYWKYLDLDEDNNLSIEELEEACRVTLDTPADKSWSKDDAAFLTLASVKFMCSDCSAGHKSDSEFHIALANFRDNGSRC